VTKGVFFRLCNDLQTKNSTGYFIQKPDCTGKIGLSAPQKITSALRQLGYGVSSDATDEYVRIGDTTARQSLKNFAEPERDFRRECCKRVSRLLGEPGLHACGMEKLSDR
ncbi:hypothetical protein PSTG_18613, partial [Puccinia striiformis f. sp. tritici PST-78]